MENKSYVYFITDGEYVKIGVSNNVLKRIASLQTANARVLRLLDYKSSSDPYQLEDELHHKYRKYLVHYEWYNILDKFIPKGHTLLDPTEVNKFFKTKGRAQDLSAYHSAMFGTKVDNIEHVTREAYLEYLRLYRFLDSFNIRSKDESK